MTEENLLPAGKPACGRGELSGLRRCFGALDENTTTCLQQLDWRETCTHGQRQSQTHVCLVRVGAGRGSLGFRQQTQRGGWDGLCGNRLKRLESDALQLRAFLKEAWAASEARHHCEGRGGTPRCSLFPCRSSQAAEQECGPEPPPTRCCPWASGAVLSCPLPRSQTPGAAANCRHSPCKLQKCL